MLTGGRCRHPTCWNRLSPFALDELCATLQQLLQNTSAEIHTRLEVGRNGGGAGPAINLGKGLLKILSKSKTFKSPSENSLILINLWISRFA
jgi:hypothetical protein